MMQFKLSSLTERYILLTLMALLLLTACEELPTREEAIEGLDKAPVCCQSLSEIKYAPFPADTSEFIDVDATSPAFGFESGKSHFAAYELPDQAVPYRITLESYAVGGSLIDATVLNPEMAILDENYQLISTTAPGTFVFTKRGFTEAMKNFRLSFSLVLNNTFYEGAIVVDDHRARYLLIYTTDENMVGGVPFQYMDYSSVYLGPGLWLPVPMGTRQTSISHSAYGAFGISAASVYTADLDKFESLGSPTDQESYQGNGFSIRPPLPEGYRFMDKSPDIPDLTISQLHFVSAEKSGALAEAYAHSIQLDPRRQSWSGDALAFMVEMTVSGQGIDFEDHVYTESEITLNGVSCRRIDFTYTSKNPLLLINLPVSGYDIYCIHPQFTDALYPLVTRIGVRRLYAYGETIEPLPDELATFYNSIQFEAPKDDKEDDD